MPKAPEEKPSSDKKEEKKPDVKLLQQMLEVAQENSQVRNINPKFSVHGESGRVKVTVLDKETGKVIRKVPAEQVLQLMARIDEMTGVFFDQKA